MGALSRAPPTRQLRQQNCRRAQTARLAQITGKRIEEMRHHSKKHNSRTHASGAIAPTATRKAGAPSRQCCHPTPVSLSARSSMNSLCRTGQKRPACPGIRHPVRRGPSASHRIAPSKSVLSPLFTPDKRDCDAMRIHTATRSPHRSRASRGPLCGLRKVSTAPDRGGSTRPFTNEPLAALGWGSPSRAPEVQV